MLRCVRIFATFWLRLQGESFSLCWLTKGKQFKTVYPRTIVYLWLRRPIFIII